MNIKLINEVSWGGNPLAPLVHMVLSEMKIKHNLELIETDKALKKFGIKNTPAMIIDKKVVIEGTIPSMLVIKDIIKDNLTLD